MLGLLLKEKKRGSGTRVFRLSNALLNAFEALETNPALVATNADVRPVADGLTNSYFGSFVESEKVCARSVGCRLCVYNALYDDSFVAQGVTAMKRSGIEARYD